MTSIRRAALYALSFLALPMVPLLAQQQGPLKIAYINSREILDKAPGRAAAEAALNKEMEGYQGQMRLMSDSLQALIADYQKSEGTLNAQQKEQRQKTIRDKQEQYQQRAQQLEQQAQQRQMAYVQPLMDQIRQILDAIRQEEGYAFILDAGSEANVIVAADRTLDLTSKVIARLKPVTAAAPGTARPDTSRGAAGARPAPAGVTRKP